MLEGAAIRTQTTKASQALIVGAFLLCTATAPAKAETNDAPAGSPLAAATK